MQRARVCVCVRVTFLDKETASTPDIISSRVTRLPAQYENYLGFSFVGFLQHGDQSLKMKR